MLKRLWVKNYALIEDSEINPDKGLNVITGETGAGKSILLGALGLVLGQRAEGGVLRNSAEKCVVEAEFDIADLDLSAFFNNHDLDEENWTVLRREIAPGGKSRAFINDTPVPLQTLKELGDQLVQIHTQHTGISIIDPAVQLHLLDAYANNQSLLKQYQQTYKDYKELEKNIQQLKDEQSSWLKEKDYYQFLYDELEQFKPVPQEEDRLEEQIQLLSKASEVKEFEEFAFQILTEGEDAVADRITILRNKLRTLTSSGGSKSEQLLETLEKILADVKELVPEIERWSRQISADPEILEKSNERLAGLQHLLKKHRAESSLELLTVMGSLEAKLAEAEAFEEQIAKESAALEAARKHLNLLDEELTARRLENAPSLVSETLKWLYGLEMPHAQLTFQATQQEESPKPNGSLSVQFLFSANKGKVPQTLIKGASGGELSRLNFAMHTAMAGRKALPTLIFDEVDTGISGEVAMKMGEMMSHLGNTHQILAITHLPQVAAKGHTHFFVFKETQGEQTVSKLKALSEKERLEEIAIMLGGKSMGEASIAAAKELLLRN